MGLLWRRFLELGLATWAVVLMTSILFGLAHAYQGRAGILGTGVLGVLFAIARILYRSLVPVMIWHTAVDIVAGIAGPQILVNAIEWPTRTKESESYWIVTLMPTDVEKPLSEATIRHALGEFQITVNEQQVFQIQQYIKTLRHWNEKLNLTAIREPLEILYRHFCESMFAAGAIPVENGRLADIGSGPGFPGLPMKILKPEIELFLVESNIKKGTFLAEIIRELELEGHSRADKPL